MQVTTLTSEISSGNSVGVNSKIRANKQLYMPWNAGLKSLLLCTFQDFCYLISGIYHRAAAGRQSNPNSLYRTAYNLFAVQMKTLTLRLQSHLHAQIA